MNTKLFIRFTLPLTLLTLLLFSARGTIDHIDGPNEFVMGFPFLWLIDSMVCSCCSRVSIPAVLLNLLFYLFACLLITRVTIKHIDRLVTRTTSIILWSMTCLFLLYPVVVIALDGSFFDWINIKEPDKLINYGFKLYPYTF